MQTDQLYIIREDTASNIHLLSFINDNIEHINALLRTNIKIFTVDKKMLNDSKYLEALQKSNINTLPALISNQDVVSIEQPQNIIGHYITKFKELEEQTSKVKEQPPKELYYSDVINSEILGGDTVEQENTNDFEDEPLDVGKINMTSRSNNKMAPPPAPSTQKQSPIVDGDSNRPKLPKPAKVEKLEAEDEQLLEKLGCNIDDGI